MPKRSWRPSQFDRAAFVLVLLCGATWVAWHHWPDSAFLQAWGPGIGTDFASIAVALAIIDRLTTRRERHRVQQVRERVYRQIAIACRDFCEMMAYDYVETHVDNYMRLPVSGLAVLEHWNDGRGREDDPATHAPAVTDPIHGAIDIGARLERWRDTGADLIEPSISARLLDFITEVDHLKGLVASLSRVGGLAGIDVRRSQRVALIDIVARAYQLGELITTVIDSSVLDLLFVRDGHADTLHAFLVENHAAIQRV